MAITVASGHNNTNLEIDAAKDSPTGCTSNAQCGGATGVCIISSMTCVQAKNNIMSGNGTLTQMDQVGGTCTHTYSIARPGTLPSGTGNIASDPLFLNTTTGDLHIQAGSPA